ncbi:MAG: hypothetical protein ROO76_18985 [Terriglobia bacterium]|jgi:tetratricopeptide (TPR) repeat protein|nr:hypothetical protein [Terriglobia bacterium]
MKLLKALSGILSRSLFAATILCCSTLVFAQETPRLTLDTDSSIFTVLAGMNACGFDEDLSTSLPLRNQIRNDIRANIEKSVAAQDALSQLCQFYNDHRQPTAARNLAQYVSLALNLDDPPALSPKLKEADMPPDAVYVLGAIPLLQNFYITAELGNIWKRHEPDYNALIEQYHRQVAGMLFSTDIYLKRQLSSYVGRSFVVYLEPMGAPGQVNARNYGDDYFMVVTPGTNGIKIDQIRHTYLHYILDPLILKRANQVKRISPILETVANSPLDDSYKKDASLLITESIIRAVEARLIGGPKGPEEPRQAAVQKAMSEGFVLTRYFYDCLVKFEKDPAGLNDSYGIWLMQMDVSSEVKRARGIAWARTSTEEVVHAGPRRIPLVDQAERLLASGDVTGAEKLAHESLDAHQDTDRALFLLARASLTTKKAEDAKSYFTQTIEATSNPRLKAWSHIYLGRILDLSNERAEALKHYKAALDSGDNSPDIKHAAENGLKEQFRPPQAQN